MRIFFIFIILSILSISAAAQDMVPKTPSTEHLMLSKELGSDSSILPLTCGLLTAVDRKKPNAENQIKAQKENSRVKLLLFQASKSKDQKVKAKYGCEAGGGAESVNYLLVENGSARFVEDLTRDSSGGNRINQMTCKNLNIGYLDKKKGDASYKFVPFKDEKYADKIIVLQCKTADRTFLF